MTNSKLVYLFLVIILGINNLNINNAYESNNKSMTERKSEVIANINTKNSLNSDLQKKRLLEFQFNSSVPYQPYNLEEPFNVCKQEDCIFCCVNNRCGTKSQCKNSK